MLPSFLKTIEMDLSFKNTCVLTSSIAKRTEIVLGPRRPAIQGHGARPRGPAARRALTRSLLLGARRARPTSQGVLLRAQQLQPLGLSRVELLQLLDDLGDEPQQGLCFRGLAGLRKPPAGPGRAQHQQQPQEERTPGRTHAALGGRGWRGRRSGAGLAAGTGRGPG